jgi:hypothetical protein
MRTDFDAKLMVSVFTRILRFPGSWGKAKSPFLPKTLCMKDIVLLTENASFIVDVHVNGIVIRVTDS